MKIAINIGGTIAPAWKVAAGALEYAIRHEDVEILLPYAPGVGDNVKDPGNWDAAIVRTPKPERGIPQVSVHSVLRGDNLSATIDENEVARSAIDQFVSMGLGTIAFYGRTDWPLASLRWERFSQYLESLGRNSVLVELWDPERNEARDPREALLRLRKPCGIMTFNDELALKLLDICSEIGLRVPGDIHVISVDDTSACLQVSPTLSSISMPFSAIGYHAADLCAKLVRGEPVKSIEIPPSGLIIRDSIKVEHDDIRTASEIAHYLRTNLSTPILMEDLVRRSSMSRRRLEQIFRAAYGSSPIAYLKELRVDRAKEMLRTSDTPLKDIVKACGFHDSTHICRIFKKRLSMTPLQYRKSKS